MTTIKPAGPGPRPDSTTRFIPASAANPFPAHPPTVPPAPYTSTDRPGDALSTASPPPALPRQQIAPGDPYCANCGYLLKDLVDSCKCPECGRPLVDVLVRGRSNLAGKQRRYRTEAMLFGLPIIDLCMGLDEQGKIGRAKGIIAIGDYATGFIAVGNKWANGVVALGGGGSFGLCAVGGGCSIGLLTAGAGGLGLGGFALGGCAMGGIAMGGFAVGGVAQGGAAIGYYARGGSATGVHTIGARGTSSQKPVEVFARLEPYIGRPGPGLSMFTPIALVGAIDFLITGLILILALIGHRRWKSLSRRGASS